MEDTQISEGTEYKNLGLVRARATASTYKIRGHFGNCHLSYTVEPLIKATRGHPSIKATSLSPKCTLLVQINP